MLKIPRVLPLHVPTLSTIEKWLKRPSTKQGFVAILGAVYFHYKNTLSLHEMEMAIITALGYIIYPEDKSMENKVEEIGSSVLSIFSALNTPAKQVVTPTSDNLVTHVAGKTNVGSSSGEPTYNSTTPASKV